MHEKIGLFNSNMRLVGDLDFFYRILVNGGKGKLIRKTLASFMVRKSSIANVLADDYKKEGRSVMKKYGINSKRWQYLVTEGIYLGINFSSLLKYQIAKRKRSF